MCDFSPISPLPVNLVTTFHQYRRDMISFAYASDTNLVNRPKISVFVKFYSNQVHQWNFYIPHNEIMETRNMQSYIKIGRCLDAKSCLQTSDRQTINDNTNIYSEPSNYNPTLLLTTTGAGSLADCGPSSHSSCSSCRFSMNSWNNTNARIRTIPYNTIPCGPPWPSFVTISAEAKSVLAHCRCPAGTDGRVGSVPGIQVQVLHCYSHFYWQCVCVVCEGLGREIEGLCAYYLAGSACTLGFSEAMHCL